MIAAKMAKAVQRGQESLQSFRLRRLAIALAATCLPELSPAAEPPENFRRENLVAWCIVPFDAKKRSPAERAEMVARLGLKRVAYDWREEHLPELEAEILAYREHGIEMFAFWRGHEKAYELFETHGIKPQIWRTLQTGKGLSNAEKVADAADKLVPLAQQTAERGLALGLYNHGGWGGLPINLVAVCEALKEKGFGHVGIVYNFHHSHPRIDDFDQDLRKMLPHLHCVTLNGMADPARTDISRSENRTRPIGTGDHEAAMIASLIARGYKGPVAVLGHVATRDVEEVLRENLEGLERILEGSP